MKGKKVLSALVSLMLLMLLPAYAMAAAWDGTADTSWYSSDKTEFSIATAEQLAGMNLVIQGKNGFEPDTFNGKTIKLTADIDLGGKQWQPIGKNNAYHFEGTFDGGGHKISNLNIVSTEEEALVGLFARVAVGSIENLTIESGTVSSKDASGTGAIAGKMSEGASIVNCVNKANVSSNSDCVGGITGIAIDGNDDKASRIIGCVNTGAVQSKGEMVGGICGKLYNSFIWGCHNEGKIQASSYAGGILGLLDASQVNDSYNLGEVLAEKKYAGGIFGATKDQQPKTFGTNYHAKIREIAACYNAGKVSVTSGTQDTVGLLGGAYTENYNCYALAQGNVLTFGEKGEKGQTAAVLKNAATGLGSNYMAGSSYPVHIWDKGGAMPSDLDGLAVQNIVGKSATGCVVVMNKRLGYEELTTSDIEITIKVNGKEVTPDNTKTKLKFYEYQGKIYHAMEYSWEPLGSDKDVVITAAYKGSKAFEATFHTPHTNNWLYYAADEFAGGDGTAENPYQIATAEQLARMSKLLNMSGNDALVNNSAKSNFKLIADIDLAAKRWQAPSNFVGTFDGNGHTISNMHGYSSLLNYIPGIKANYLTKEAPPAHQIANVTLVNAQVEMHEFSCGILARAIDDCSVLNCVIKDSELVSTLPNGRMGSFVGSIDCGDVLLGVSVENCEAQNVKLVRKMKAEDYEARTSGNAGGIVGEISCYGDYGVHAAGSVKIANCVFDGTIDNFRGEAGGITSTLIYLKGAEIENCIVKGSISNTKTAQDINGRTGGILSRIYTNKQEYIGVNGVDVIGNVVMFDKLNGYGDTVNALNKDLYTLIAAENARVYDNYAVNTMKLNGKAVAKDSNVPYELTTVAELADKGFWEKIGYDFSESGSWQWDEAAKAPKLRHDKLCYATGKIVQQPVNVKMYDNQAAYFGVTMQGGVNDYDYQWQYSKDGQTWQDIKGANQKRLEVNAKSGYGNGCRFRCIISQPYVEDMISEEAVLNVVAGKTNVAKIKSDLLAAYQEKGSINGAGEAMAIYAAGGDLSKLSDERIFYQAYMNGTSYGDDFYTAAFDGFVLGENITDTELVWSDKTEKQNWIEYILNKQKSSDGLLYALISTDNDISKNTNTVSMMTVLEMFFDGADWGNESTEEKLGRSNGIEALLGMLQEDSNGKLKWGTNNHDSLDSDAWADYAILMCRLVDDDVFGERAKAAAGKVLDKLCAMYDEETAAGNYRNMATVRDNAKLVSALVAYADKVATGKQAAEYMQRAEQIVENVIIPSAAVGGGYSVKVLEHDMTADTSTTAVVLQAMADYENGKAFLADYSYDMAPEAAVKQVLNTIKFPTTIYADLDLSSKGSFGTTLSWQSSDPSVISNSGKVNKQSERKNVTLTLTATKGKAKLEQKYDLIVRAIGADDNDDVDEALDIAVKDLSCFTETNRDLILPVSKQAGVEFSYQSSDNSVLSADGKVNRPAAGAADKTVKLTLTAKKGSVVKSIEQDVLVYAKSNTNSSEGKIREAYIASRVNYLHNRNIDGYWNVFAAYSVLGDYLNRDNGYTLTLPEPTIKWYGTQYGAMVMGIVAAGENPYNYRGCDWVQLLNENYGGMYAAGLYSSLGMAAAGADPAVYNAHKDDSDGASLTQDRAMGLDIAGWAAVVLAGNLDTGSDYLINLKDDFMNYLMNVTSVGKDGNFAGGNGISTNCVLLGLNALYWAGVEDAYPLADHWRHAESGVSIVDVCYDANWGKNSEFGSYSGQAVLTFGDLYNVLYKGGTPAWLDIALNKDKLDKQIAKAESLIAQADKYTEESVNTVKAALATVKAIPSDKLNAELVSWGKEYFALYDAVRFAEEK